MDVSFLAEFDEDKCIFRFVESNGSSKVVAGDTVALDDTICGLIASGELSGVIGDVVEHPAAVSSPFVVQHGIRSFVGAPVILPDGRLYGLLGGFGRRPDPMLRPRDGQFVSVLASFVSGMLLQQRRSARRDHDRVGRIEEALTGENLSIVFQPIVDLHHGVVMGAEALSRFDSDPYHPPNKWFADAASIGLGVELELIAARKSLAHLDQLAPKIYLSINLSPLAVRAAHGRGALRAASTVAESSSSSPSTRRSTTTRRSSRRWRLCGPAAADRRSTTPAPASPASATSCGSVPTSSSSTSACPATSTPIRPAGPWPRRSPSSPDRPVPASSPRASRHRARWPRSSPWASATDRVTSSAVRDRCRCRWSSARSTTTSRAHRRRTHPPSELNERLGAVFGSTEHRHVHHQQRRHLPPRQPGPVLSCSAAPRRTCSGSAWRAT